MDVLQTQSRVRLKPPTSLPIVLIPGLLVILLAVVADSDLTSRLAGGLSTPRQLALSLGLVLLSAGFALHRMAFRDLNQTGRFYWKTAILVALPIGLAALAIVPIGMRYLDGEHPPPLIGATSVAGIKVKTDFKVELLYAVPKDRQGTWVCLCVDPKGRLITSNQTGKLYRVTPPAIGGPASGTHVEELPVDLGEAHGLVWAHDSLYVVVSRQKAYENGLWRVWSSRGNDVLDSRELLRELTDLGFSEEHGPHAVLLGPDGNSLYVVCGNSTKLTALASSTVPQVWGEDCLLPRLWDPKGHALGVLAPGGCIYQTDMRGKNWKLISMGHRNTYDAAFNRDGELFTVDNDMDWDFNLPWYRPTRVVHAVPGSEFGWRAGNAKMYEQYPDNLPAVLNIGPGAPSGVTFGYGARFPAKYQDALYACDWSYGKLNVIHLTPRGSSYTGELEEFLTGSPLPLTDIVVNPIDGAMYFTIGGRGTMSALYRLTYVGNESTVPASPSDSNADRRAIRHRLESFYGRRDAQVVQEAWPYLSSDDRHLRYAARTVLEFQEPSTWQAKALQETESTKSINAILGLARVANRSLGNRLLDALDRITWSGLNASQKVDLLRTYQLIFIRMEPIAFETKNRVSKRLDACYPASLPAVDAELCKLLSYLDHPDAVTKTLSLLANAATQEEQIEYVTSLRVTRGGWSSKQRQDYFDWFLRAADFGGGQSFHGYLANIRKEAIDTLSAQERQALTALLDRVPQPTSQKHPTQQRQLVKNWTVDDLVPLVEKGLTNRNFERGRAVFAEARCFACHRCYNEGGPVGPDLSGAGGRFGARDLLESIIEPSKIINDQYKALVFNTKSGKVLEGRIVNFDNDRFWVNQDMLNPGQVIYLRRDDIESMQASNVSMMPTNLLDGFTQEEILDLVAYLYSRGNRKHEMFKQPKD
jgi:putative heme-binding domain-containing protein